MKNVTFLENRMLKVLYQKHKAKYSKLNVKTEEKTVTDSSQQPSQQKGWRKVFD